MKLATIFLVSTLCVAQVTMSGGMSSKGSIKLGGTPVAEFLATVTGSGTTLTNNSRSGVFTQTFGLTTHAPSWIGAGLSFSGLQYTTGTTSNTLTLNQVSVYAAVQWVGSQQLSGYSPIVGTASGGATPDLEIDAAHIGSTNNGNQATFLFGGQTAIAYAANLNDGNWHVVAGTYDGTTLKYYVDNALVQTKTTAITPISLADLQISNLNTSASWPGLIGYVLVTASGDSASQVAATSSGIYKLMATRSVTITDAANYLAFEGDSITDPTQCAKPCYYWLNNIAISPLVAASRNFGLGGSSVSTMNARAATVDAVYASRTHNILTILIGANDGATNVNTFETTLASYVQARQATGWKVYVWTVLPQTTANFNANFRTPVNTWIIANSMGANGIINITGDSNIGCDACAANATYYSDGEHPTAAGQAIMATYEETAVNFALAH